jgi:hypothetical protein
MTYRHRLTRRLRSMGKAEADTEAETAETETARYHVSRKSNICLSIILL